MNLLIVFERTFLVDCHLLAQFFNLLVILFFLLLLLELVCLSDLVTNINIIIDVILVTLSPR